MNAGRGQTDIGGIRARGADIRRTETFVDAAFAFALTLLVISFDAVPGSYPELMQALRAVPAFAASFAIIVMLWYAHHTWSRRYGLDDLLSTLLSIVLIFVVMIYVYPLRSMMSAALAFMTNGWVPSEFLLSPPAEGGVAELRGLFTVYGAGFAISCGCIVLLYLRALRVADKLQLSEFERFVTRGEISAWAIVASAGLLSILLAQLLPQRLLGFAGWTYALLPVLMPAYGYWLDRRGARWSSTA